MDFAKPLALMAALMLAGAARAADDTPLTAEAFDALTLGKTMDTASGGTVYGIETFLPGRRVVWRDARRCVEGQWQQVADEICFTYADKPDRPVCWLYFDRGDRIEGRHSAALPGSDPIVLTPGDGPISCDGFLGA